MNKAEKSTKVAKTPARSRCFQAAVNVPEPGETRRTGFLLGVLSSPDDFDRIGCSAIERLFEGDA